MRILDSLRRSRPEFRRGVQDALPIALGYVPLGISYGAFAVSVGLPSEWTILTAVFIYAGSMEFLAASMLVAGAPLGQGAATALFVNSRHVFYGLSVPMERVRPLWLRIYAIHALTDETYAVLATKPAAELTGPRILAAALSAHAYWVVGTVIGAILAEALPFDLSFMGFAMTALFVVLAIDAVRAGREWGLFLAAVVIGLVGVLVLGEWMLVGALCAYAVAALAVVLRRRRRDAADPQRRSDGAEPCRRTSEVDAGSAARVPGDADARAAALGPNVLSARADTGAGGAADVPGPLADAGAGDSADASTAPAEAGAGAARRADGQRNRPGTGPADLNERPEGRS